MNLAGRSVSRVISRALAGGCSPPTEKMTIEQPFDPVPKRLVTRHAHPPQGAEEERGGSAKRLSRFRSEVRMSFRSLLFHHHGSDHAERFVWNAKVAIGARNCEGVVKLTAWRHEARVESGRARG